jgi:hypothetical protein
LSNRSVLTLLKSDSDERMSFNPTPKSGPASSNPIKNAVEKHEITSKIKNRIRVNGVRLSRMGCLWKSTDFGYFCC